MEESTPKFISNLPIGEDQFEGKSQDKVAEYIAANLSSNDTCQIAGIDGGWGSGKSNLIEIIKKKLNVSYENKYHFFIYDAWGHQEDLQRRSFLEELTYFLTKNEKAIIGEPEKWEIKLKQLLAKSKETQKKTIPSLSLGIVFSALILIITPLFKSISEIVDCSWLKIAITMIPLSCLISVFMYYYICKTEKGAKRKVRIDEAIHKLFYIYQQTQKEDITFETVSEDEPSVKKFRDWMKAIAEDLGENRLVIVFDNMDRLPDQKITELWSSIHTFFAESRYSKIKVLIPFDRQNIKNAFKYTGEDKQSYTDDFINKTFDIVYRVSPPILSDWKKYFKIKWKEAFGDRENELSKVVQVFDHLAVSKTPREMVVFINECVTTHQINKDVPLRYVALFIVAKATILKSPDDEIIKPTYLKSLGFIYHTDDYLPQYIAALVYQIDHNKSLEIIFTDKLKSALDNNRSAEIASISENGVFNDILDKALMLVENYKNAVLSLDHLGDKVSQDLWDDLFRRLDPQLGEFLNAKIEEFHIIVFLKITHKKAFLKNVINRLINATNFSAFDYYQSIKLIEKNIKENKFDLKLEDFLIEKNTLPKDFVDMLKATNDNNTYKVSTSEKELNDYLETIEDQNELLNSKYLSKIPSKLKLTQFNNSLESRISASQGDRALSAAYYQAYKYASTSVVKVLINDANIYSHFANSPEKDNFYYDTISMRIVKGNSFQSPYTTYFEPILANTDSETINNLYAQISYFISYGDLLIDIKTLNSELVKSVAAKLTNEPLPGRRLLVVSVLKKFDAINSELMLPEESLIKRLNDWNDQTISAKNIEEIITNTELLRISAKFNYTLTKKITDGVVNYLENLAQDAWKTEFSNPESYIVKAALIVLPKQFPGQAVSACKDILLEIAKDELPIPDQNTWRNILNKSNTNSVKSGIKDVRDLFLNAKEIDISLFRFFADWLFEFGELGQNASSLRRIFRKGILEDELSATLILKYSSFFVEVYNNSEEKEDFNNELQVLFHEGKNHIKKIADLLELKLHVKVDKKD